MGLLIDGIIGPVLETFGVIEIGEDGEWTRRKREVSSRKERQKKERENKENLWRRFMKWLRKLASHFKIKKNRVSFKDQEKTNKSLTEVVNDIISSGRRTRDISKEKLRRISKFEGKILSSNDGYKIWYGGHFPYDDEVEEGVVYVVKGQGDLLFNTGPLAGIRQDAYYVWDKAKETFEPNGTMSPKETITNKDAREITIKSGDDDTRWYYTGSALLHDPTRNYLIYPNTIDDHDDTTDGMRPWGIL